ncbi:transketolase [uncultured Bilophila sp.]|nr:transketolase [uncultured Bilophila sp.]
MRSRKELADAVRILSMDAVDKAKSGHPGAPMGMADMAEALWRGVLRHNPANPHWANRDRFVLSNGHASMLLYSLLHLTGYDLSMDDIKAFRQLGSRTPGHPEFGVTPGVETTTGPLGQGFATAVGMAVAEKLLAAEFNREGFPIVDHHTYVFLGDGCLMEGLSQEACSLAGTLGLGKLIVLYDDNGISIDGKVSQWFGDDTPARFEACGWQVIPDVDGHDAAMLDAALTLARKETARPTLICCKTTIGYGSSKKGGTASCHGSPMGEEENAAVRAALGWTEPPFVIPQDIRDAWDARQKGAALQSEWDALFAAYRAAYPDLAVEFERRMSGALPADWEAVSKAAIERFDADKPKVATRIANRDVLNALAPHLPELFGGSADLTGSVGTWHEKAVRIGRDEWHGNYLSYGVREFGMGAVMNGLALHGGFIPYGGTFLVFSDYARNAIRLSALMKQRLVWVLTHDSIGVGEDGPTHQPIEHVSSLRLIPDLWVWRPCDAVETAVAWKTALESAEPSCMILTRQGLAPQARTAGQLEAVRRGGYVLRDCDGAPEVILIATGSEVQLAVDAAAALTAKGRKVRVVSMPCTELFDAQPADYRESVLPAAVRARVAVEAASVDGWWKYVGLDGAVVGMSTFGESAPGGELFKHFGFTVEHVAEVAEGLLK